MHDKSKRRQAGNPTRQNRAIVEQFENRMLFTTVVVNTILDSTDSSASATVSLRDAIAKANTSATPTTITFDPTVFTGADTILLGGTQLALVQGSTTITGPAMPLTINGNNKSRVLVVGPDATANLSNLTISNGNISTEYGGGGIANYGKLVLNDSTITDNRSTGTKQTNNQSVQGYGGGLENLGTAACDNDIFSSNSSLSNGAGVDNYTNATLTLTDSTVTGNAASVSGGGLSNGGDLILIDDTVINNTSTLGGGGISSDNILTLTNVTVTGNKDTGDYFGGGGGIFIANDTGFGVDGMATLTNVTITGNTAQPGFGGGMKVEQGAVDPQIGNTIIAGNLVDGAAAQSGDDVVGTYNSSGSNLVGDTDGSSGFGSSDLTGTSASPLVPRLGALANNGGITLTAEPLSGSPAIDHGNNSLVPSTLALDQTDAPRISNGTVDIGAVEVQTGVEGTIATQTKFPHTDDPVILGSSVTLTATVVPASTASSAPTGTVTFESAGATLGVIPIDSSGSATLTLSTLSVGIQTISAIYSGDTIYERSISASATQTIQVPSAGNPTAITITSTLTKTTPGTPVLVTAHVTSSTGKSTTATGSVVFLESTSGGQYTYTVVKLDSGGSAQLSVTSLPQGFNSFTATYEGDSTYSSSASGQQVVIANNSVLNLSITGSSLATTLIAGQKLHGTVKLILTNPTQSAIKETATLNLTEMSAPAPTLVSSQILSRPLKINLAHGKSIKIAIPINLSTQILAAADYTLEAQLVELSNLSAYSTPGPALTIVAPTIDLSSTLAQTSPASHRTMPGKTATFSLEIVNHGNTLANGITNIITSISPNSDGSSATSLATLAPRLHVAPGGHQIVRYTYKIPVGTLPGTYYFLADVDPQHMFAETDLTNNLAITSTPLTVFAI